MNKLFYYTLSLSLIGTFSLFSDVSREKEEGYFNGYHQMMRRSNTQPKRMQQGRYSIHYAPKYNRRARTRQEGYYCQHCKWCKRGQQKGNSCPKKGPSLNSMD